ncbi:MAG: cell division protein [Alphaproteobacteria bacterium]
MLRNRTDLPLQQDASRRFLPWLVAIMVYLATLALAGLLVLNDAAGRWDRGLSGTLTVQIPPLTGQAAARRGTKAREQKRVAKAMKVLRGTPGIVEVRVLDNAEIKALLEPWLGTGDFAAELPLPALIDVKIRPDARINMDGLSAVLDGAVPGTTVDDHRKWLDHLILLARFTQLIAAGIVFLVSAAAIATVIFVTRAGLSIHHEFIELMHFIGAQDGYVARQFQFQALGLGLSGSIIGFVLAAATLLALGLISAQLQASPMPKMSLDLSQWLMLAAIPVIVSLISMITARVTVLKVLARMP